MDSQRSDMLRGAFAMTTTAAAKPAMKSEQQVYDSEYKKFVAKGFSTKQAGVFADQIVKRLKAAGKL